MIDSPALVIGRKLSERVKKRVSQPAHVQDAIYERIGADIVEALQQAGYEIVRR